MPIVRYLVLEVTLIITTMKNLFLLLLLVLMGLEASAQKVDLVKLGNTLRNKNLSMELGIEEGDRFVVRDNATTQIS